MTKKDNNAPTTAPPDELTNLLAAEINRIGRAHMALEHRVELIEGTLTGSGVSFGGQEGRGAGKVRGDD